MSCAEDLLGLLEHLQSDGGHRGKRTDPVVAPDDPAGLAGHPRRDGIAFGHNDVRDAALAQRPRSGRTLDAAADDDDVRGLVTRPGDPVGAGQRHPGHRRRLDGHRDQVLGLEVQTCALPHARAMVWASMVSTRR